MVAEKPREHYNREAASQFNSGQNLLLDLPVTGTSQLSHLTRGALYLSQGKWEDGQRAFDTILMEKPTNIPALLGKVEAMYRRPRSLLTTVHRPNLRMRAVNIRRR